MRPVLPTAPGPKPAGDAHELIDEELVEAEADAQAQAQPVEFVVPDRAHGARLDRCLADAFAGLSRSFLQATVLRGDVELDGRAITKPSASVKAGQCCRVRIRPTAQSQAFVAQPVPLDVVHEDEHVLVLHKPAGLVVHPAAGNWSGTVLNGLLAHHAGAAQLPRAGIVHRLDKDTSGLMVVAKTRPAMDRLVEQIAAREVTRLYLALCSPPWAQPPQLVVDAAIGRDPANRLRMAVARTGQGKPARTQFRLLASGAQLSLLGCKLFTGRTHQIRVHAAAVGHPLVGDGLYRGRPHAGLSRQGLHAARLILTHPHTGQRLDCHAPLPADMAAVCQTEGLAWEGLAYNARPIDPEDFATDAPVCVRPAAPHA